MPGERRSISGQAMIYLSETQANEELLDLHVHFRIPVH